jgi:hypothetical protein
MRPARQWRDEARDVSSRSHAHPAYASATATAVLLPPDPDPSPLSILRDEQKCFLHEISHSSDYFTAGSGYVIQHH